MRVEKGIPKSPPLHKDTAPSVDVVKTSGAGEGACKRSACLPDEEACADEDDDDHDSRRRRRSSSCQFLLFYCPGLAKLSPGHGHLVVY